MPGPALNEPDEVTEPRRNSELSMLMLAFGVVAFAFINVAGSLNGQHFSSILGYLAAFVVVTLCAHLAFRRWAPYGDPQQLPLATILNGLGIALI